MHWWRKRREDDLNREIQSHLELEAEEHRESTASDEDARYAALRQFGNPTLIREVTREMWGWTSLERTWQDLRYAVRSLRKTPGFTAAAVGSLALGIGANTAIFSLLNAVVLRMLPVAEPQQLVQFTYTQPGPAPNNWNSWFGYPQYERFSGLTKTLSGVFGGAGLGRVNVGYRGSAGLAQGDAYTDNFFSVLGVTPQYGRFFTAGEDRADASVAILSDRYWRDRFGADPSLVGATITLNQLPFTVIGIAPPEFTGITVGMGPDLWVPLHTLDRFNPNRTRWTESFTSWMLIAGRLRPGVSQAQTQSEVDVIHRQLIAEQLSVSELRNRESMQRFVRESHLALRSAGTGMYSGLRNNYELPLKLLMWVAGIVLLVACANVANLLLARASKRRLEIAVRLALGAGRARVIRQLLTESILLAGVGGVVALAIAWWGSTLLVRVISTGESPIPLDVHPDWRIFGFTAGVSLITGILFGLAPAVRGTRVDPGPAIKEGARQATRSSRLLDRALVVVQVALSVVLITGAGLFVRTLGNLWSVNLGYDRENVLMFSLDAQLAGYPRAKAGAVYRDVLQKLQALPDVRSASVSFVRPVDDRFYLVNMVEEIDGHKLPEADRIRIAWNSMSPGYFNTVGTPILLGRDFDLRDNETAPKVVIVNESLAARALPGQNPIGHRLGDATIIGVVKDTHYNGVLDKPRPVRYNALFQTPPGFDVSFELRYRSGAALLDRVRSTVASVDRNLPIYRARTLRAQTEQSLWKNRLLALLSSFFGALALLIACLGLYGLMAYAVSRRTGEIGIRIALGAHRGHVMWLVLRETLWLALSGIALGIPLALWTARYAKSLLYGVEAADPLAIAVTVTALIAIAAIAGYIPGRRAVRVDPMVALRYE
jgi:predicted permease